MPTQTRSPRRRRDLTAIILVDKRGGVEAVTDAQLVRTIADDLDITEALATGSIAVQRTTRSPRRRREDE